MTETIVRKDGITYTRKKRETKEYNTKLNIRVSQVLLDDIKKIAQDKNIAYSDLIRSILKDYLESEVN